MSAMHRSRRLAVGIRPYALVLACGASLVQSDAPPLARAWTTRNVIVVTLDTTRADYLPAYGSVSLTTPAIDRLARDGVVFEQATTTAPLTLPAHCSIFTGLLPEHHAVRDNADPPLDSHVTTLAEILRARGMRTGAFVGAAVLASGRGLEQGFDRYSEPMDKDQSDHIRRSADVVVGEALDWIAVQREAPYFAWIHLYDAHAPYLLPEPYRSGYADAPYLGALAVIDAQIGRLVGNLERRHQLDETLIVLAADHGESLGDHGEDGHGIFVYQSTLRVPLIVRVPRMAPRRVTDVTRLIDVMPTVLELQRIAAPLMDGVSLVPLMTGAVRQADLEAYSESAYPQRFGWSGLRALRAGRFKYVSAPRPELYDLERDPAEEHNIVTERAALASMMAARLDALAGPASVHRPIDDEVAARLGALGYVASGVSDAARKDQRGSAIDPKDCIGRYNEIVRRNRARARGDGLLAQDGACKGVSDHGADWSSVVKN